MPSLPLVSLHTPMDNYLGIEKEYQSLYKQGGSKFYGYIFPVRNEEAAKAKIAELRQEYADATHVCPAYVIGLEREIQYFSDDGEPSNSAGRPILNALLSAELSYILAVVVRYYGGKKLGIPGLIESYGAAAQLCIDQAEVKELELRSTVQCSIDIAQSYHLYNFLNSRKEFEYDADGSEFIISCNQSMTPELLNELSKIPTLVVRNED